MCKEERSYLSAASWLPVTQYPVCPHRRDEAHRLESSNSRLVLFAVAHPWLPGVKEARSNKKWNEIVAHHYGIGRRRVRLTGSRLPPDRGAGVVWPRDRWTQRHHLSHRRHCVDWLGSCLLAGSSA